MPTLQEIQDLRFSALEEAKEEWARSAHRFGGYQDRVETYLRRPLKSDWSGKAADAAQSRLDRLEKNFQFGSQECTLIEATIDGFVTEMKEQQKRLRKLLDDAAAKGLKVLPSGEVTYKDEGSIPTGDPDAGTPDAEVERRDLEGEILSVRRTVDEIDGRYSVAISRLQADRGLKVDSRESRRDASDISQIAGTAVGLDSAPHRGTDPKKVHEWWNGLSQEERDEQLALNPDVIGNLDGIPAETRDEANRVNLDRLIDAHPPGSPMSEEQEEKQKGYRAIRDRLDRDDGKVPEPLLLGIGGEGQGRAILSYGNPDTADNVAAYVPGFSTTLESVGGEDGDRAQQVWNSSGDAGGRKTASIVWLGYDAPQSIEVAADGPGKRGGADFGTFLEGVQATHQGEKPHVTAIGHSYGSFAVGQGAQRPGGIPADDIILVGSPGTGAQKAEDLGVGKGHVWVGAAENDPVTHAPSKKESMGGSVGIAIGSIFNPHQLWFGQDPASQDFGGIRFGVADGEPFHSHSNYFKDPDGGDSLGNMGAIVAGHPEKVSLQAGR
ncbi:alpha/beta hydrolase [Streptomyces catenulae]|uniref:Alpha/beta hydrolase n=1 Tax=Streptomyces catenulae TaxID=66875 RepID=A0ABV2YXD5_9ACTN|nr:alpha/beta hydrolase [Streptomyces catenulae]